MASISIRCLPAMLWSGGSGLSISQARGEFMLKGALLFDLWFDVPHRPTRDADFLGFCPTDAKVLARTVQMVCRISVDDGMQFDSDSVNVVETRKGSTMMVYA